MKNFNTDKIIVALGLHNQDECLLEYVEFLNRQFDFKEIISLHVLPKSTPVLEVETAQITHQDYDAQADYERQVEENVDEYISNYIGQKEQYAVKFGDIEEEILRAAEDEKAQLVLLGQKNKVALRVLSAEKIVREAKTTLLIIPEGSVPRIRKILVPVDLSEASLEALKIAIQWNSQLKNRAEITVLNVTGNEEKPLPDLQTVVGTTQKIREDSRKNFLRGLIKKNLDGADNGLEIDVVSRGQYTPAESIVQYAERKDFDFVVMGAKGGGTFSTVLFGSTTEAVVKGIKKIPVLVTKNLATNF